MTPDLLVFSDDWGRHPSSCQHLVTRLLPRHRVLWVNTIGTRRPSLDLYSLSRGFEKLRGWWRRPERENDAEEANPRVASPAMWPSFGSTPARRLNRRLLERALRPRLPADGSCTAVTTVPIVADLVGRLDVARWVYYCVDDLSAWPGLDGPTLLAMEKLLVERVDRVVAVSETLQRRIRSMGRDSELLTHGVDLDHWRRPGDDRLPSALDRLERPWVVFWGVVDRRLDLDLLARLCERMTEGTVLLVGPDNEPEPRLSELPRLQRMGALPYSLLPRLARSMACAIMPYRDAEVTRAMQPLKLKEYLATGAPVVARRLPATEEWGDACDLVDAPEDFAEAVLRRLEGGVPEDQRSARRRLATEDWQHKAERFERALFGE